MAQKKKQEPGANFRDEVRNLRANGPERLYLLCGEEEYLREQFLSELKKICLPGGEDDFCYHRFDGASLDMQALAEAVDAVPFLSDRTLLEVRGCDTNKLSESDAARLTEITEDLPDYCTLVLVMDADFSFDGRLKRTKTLMKQGRLLRFLEQGTNDLVRWVAKRFHALEKRITVEDAQYLILITGGLMNRMIPEIEKVGAFAQGEVITRADIDAVVQKVPDAVVFDMTELIAERRGDAALQKLAELLSDKSNEPIALLAAVGNQMRRLYAAKCAAMDRISGAEAMTLCGVRHDFIVQKLMRSARGFSMAQLEHAVRLCCETDYAMKHSGGDNAELLKELLLRLLAEAAA